MLVRMRTAAAVAVLVGIPSLAVLVLVATTVAVVRLVGPGSVPGMAAVAVLVLAGALLAITVGRVLTARPAHPDGVLLTRGAEKDLWAIVDRAAEAAGARRPDEVRLTTGATVRLVEDRSLGSRQPGTQVLGIGVPVLQALTRAELWFVLAHELGHLSERHPPASALTRRALVSLQDVAAGLEARHPLRWLVSAQAGVHARLAAAAWRRQELEADAWAAALSGSEVGVSALRAVRTTGATWSTFAADYASVGEDLGLAPAGLHAGYAAFLSEPVRVLVDVDLLVEEEARRRSATHPPISDRIERLHASPLPGVLDDATLDDHEPALLVLADPPASVEAVEQHDARERELTRVPWERVVPQGNQARDRAGAARLVAAADDVVGGPADLAAIMHLVADGRGDELLTALTGTSPDPDEVPELLEQCLVLLVRTALVEAGHATHVLRWDRADVVVDDAGTEVDLLPLVVGVPGDPGHAEWLLGVLETEDVPRSWRPAGAADDDGDVADPGSYPALTSV
ncbi:M48 family metallopeptidase [Nocardioides zeicaulis]|uniref:M48 family metallopeptidase n=1 Tax=Nocardioides zeicaulis TaxID=1776857 RepID=A0ABV6DZY4_9ACTN